MAITSKRYACQQCGHEKQIETSHFGQTYSIGNYSMCPKCGHRNGVTVWICQEAVPNGCHVPEPWRILELKEVKK